LNKIFNRILLGLVSVIAVLGFFSLAVIKLSNDVRLEHYWHDLINPPLSELVSTSLLADVDLPSSIFILDAELAELSDIVYARLERGQIVVDVSHDEGLFRAWIRGGEGKLVSFESGLSGNEVFELYRMIIVTRLNSLAVSEDSQIELEYLRAQLGVQISKIQNDIQISSQLMLNDLAEKGFYHFESDRGANSIVRLKSGELYKIVFPELYGVYSWPILMCLLLVFVGALLVLAYFVIQGFDRRLRAIETAASRISRGELDARVSRAGEKDAISRLGTAFNSMADHIQRLMYVQKEMIHAVSHELRTPVARIRFGVQMIADCPSEEAMQKQVKGIDGDIQELDELIDEILTYARLEQGGPILAFQEADVGAIVEQVVSEQSSVKPDMEIFSEYKKGSDVWKISEVEARYIHRSIQNLVGNATRYADGKVRVVCSFDAETCRVDVEDDGPGIPEEDWESVFTPFARLDDSRTRSSGGYGLGLSIVRRILYWHGGQAFLGRSSMGGARFSLVWPRKQSKD